MGDVLAEAIGEYEFAPNGLLFTNVPDYSNIDSWSVLNSQTRAWSAGVEVAHLGKTWVLQIGASGTQVPGAGNQWVIKIGLTTDGNGNSVPETDEVIYRLDYDWISERKDKRGNSIVASYNGDQIYIQAGYPLCIDQFAWGSSNAYSNEIFDCDFGNLLLTDIQNNHVTGNRISSSTFNTTFFVNNTLVIIDSTIDRSYFEVSSIGTIEKSEIVGSFVRYNDYMYIKNCSFLDTQVIGFSGTQSNYHTVLDGIIATNAILTSIAPAAQLIVLQNCIISGYKQFAFNEQINGKIIGYTLDGLPVAINEANLVHKTGTESIGGLKTFTQDLYINGNVGIGLTSATSNLCVLGFVESTTGGYKFPDGTTQTTAAVSGGGSGGTVYTLPVATSGALGGVMVGTGLNVNGAGFTTLLPATTTTLGGVKVSTGLNVDGNGVLTVNYSGIVKSINTIGPDNNGNVTLPIPIDIYKRGTGNKSITTSGIGENNQAGGDYSVTSGGAGNFANGYGAVVAGGTINVASGSNSVVSGGDTNTASDLYSLVAGGMNNTAAGGDSFVVGGRNHHANAFASGVIGGDGNIVNGQYSTIINGVSNTLNSSNSLIIDSSYCSVAAACNSTILIGCTNLVVTTGTNQTYINNVKVVSGGGSGGTAYTLLPATVNTLGGVMVGTGLNVNGTGTLTVNYSGIVKSINTIGPDSNGNVTLAIPSGGGTAYTLLPATVNTLGGVMVGTGLNVNGAGFTTLLPATTTTLGGVKVSTGLNVDGNGVLTVNYSGIVKNINNITPDANGNVNIFIPENIYKASTGINSITTADSSRNNIAVGNYAVISGGSLNSASGQHAVTAGGYNNHADGRYATVAGGNGNRANNESSSILGGQGNTVTGIYSSILNGNGNTVSGLYSIMGASISSNLGGDANFVAIASGCNVTGGQSSIYNFGGVLRGTTITNSSNNFIGYDNSSTLTGGGGCFLGAGTANHFTGTFHFMTTGTNNTINGNYNAVFGGDYNTLNGSYCNIFNSSHCTIDAGCNGITLINCDTLTITSGSSTITAAPRVYINNKLVFVFGQPVLTSPNGTNYQLNVSDTGVLSTVAIN